MPKKAGIKRGTWGIIATVVAAIIACVCVEVFSPRSQALSDITSNQRNIHYCNSTNPAQTLDFYRPKNRDMDKLPLLVYIHGGGWRSGSKNNPPILKVYGKSFIDRGIAIASIEYRLNTKHPYPDQNNDIACALTYLNDNASTLNIDPHQTILLGDSAGGQLAAFAALNIPYQHYDYEAPVGVIDFYGVSDFSKIVDGARPDFNARRYLGSKYNQVAVAASPVTYVTKKSPRFLFLHGTKDKEVPISQSKSLYDLLVKSGVDAEYVSLPGAKHSFTGPELSPSNYKTIQDSLSSFLQETIQR